MSSDNQPPQPLALLAGYGLAGGQGAEGLWMNFLNYNGKLGCIFSSSVMSGQTSKFSDVGRRSYLMHTYAIFIS